MSFAEPSPELISVNNGAETNGENPWESPQSVENDAEAGSQEGEVKRDVKRGILALVDQAVCSGTNFLTMALLARSLSMDAFGVFALAFLCFQFARTIQERALAAPYLVYTHRPFHNSKKLLGSNLVHQAIFSAIVLVITIVAGAVFTSIGKPVGMGTAFFALAFAIPFLLLRDQIRAISLTHFRLEVSLALNMAVAAIQLGGIGLLVAFEQVSILSATIVLGIACLIPALAWFAVRPQPFTIDRDQVGSDWRLFWGFSRWLILARSFGIGGQYLVPAIVALYLDPASVAAFATCTALVGLSMMFILGLNNFAQPRIVVACQEDGTKAMLRAVLQTVVCFAIFLGGAAIVLFIWGDELLGAIYGPSYVGYGKVAAMLSLGMLAVSISIAFQNGLVALGKPHGFLLGEFSYFCTAVGLAAVLIPRWGLIGAATSLVAAGAVVTIVTIATLFWLINADSRRIADVDSAS